MLVRLYDPASQTEYFGEVDALVALGDGLQFVGGLLTLKLKFAALGLDSGGLFVNTGGIQNGHIQDGAVGTSKIANLAVTSAKLANGSVTLGKLGPSSVGEPELQPDSVTSTQIATGAVGSAEIADGAVTGTEIATGAVDTTKIADGSVTAAKLASALLPRLCIHLWSPGPATATPTVNVPALTFVEVEATSKLTRRIVDLRGITKFRMQGMLANGPSTANKLRVEYKNSTDLTTTTGWSVLCTSAGTHANTTWFDTGELTMPVGADIVNCQLRAGIYDGNGVADPALQACVLSFYT
jgi:hypothetical protein